MRNKDTLHIVQGGIENGDKARIERASRIASRLSNWVIPMRARVSDSVVIYIRGFGLFATARVVSQTRPRIDWPNRYCATLGDVKLIDPPISLGTIRRRISKLTWALYPRSITTLQAPIAAQVMQLIVERRRTRVPDLSDEALETSNLLELRRLALLRSSAVAKMRSSRRIDRIRSRAIHLYVLRRADGECEACKVPAPFRKLDGSPYLEPHHVRRLADDGPDHPAKVIGLCPNCHRRAHHAVDSSTFNKMLIAKLKRIERALIKRR
jgi:hypothetical protein